MKRRYKALILNDYEGAYYAQWIKEGKKKIETRMKRMFSYRGDLVICCGATNSVTENAGKALCIVNLWKARPMQNEAAEIAAACIGWDKDRKSHLLKDWRHFNYDFEYKNLKVSGDWRGIFEIELPEDVTIIRKPEIHMFWEKEDPEGNIFK